MSHKICYILLRLGRL